MFDRGKAGRSADMLQSVQRNAHERGVGDAEEVARFEVRHPNEGNYLSPRGDKVFLPEGQVRLGKHIHRIVPGERLRAIAANRVHCKQLWFVGQSSAYGAIVTKVEASTRSNRVYSPYACPGVVR